MVVVSMALWYGESKARGRGVRWRGGAAKAAAAESARTRGSQLRTFRPPFSLRPLPIMALSLSAQPQLRARQSRFAGVALRGRAPAARAAPRAAAAVTQTTRAGIFDFLTPKPAEASAGAATQAFICIDCGYIYRRAPLGGAFAARTAGGRLIFTERARYPECAALTPPRRRACFDAQQRRHQQGELLLQVPRGAHAHAAAHTRSTHTQTRASTLAPKAWRVRADPALMRPCLAAPAAQCDSGKNRFKAQEASGGAYKALAAAKKQAKVVRQAASAKGERPRDKLRAAAIEAGRKMDADKGRVDKGGAGSGGEGGGAKKKGWFG
jgi:hypothetical protein